MIWRSLAQNPALEQANRAHMLSRVGAAGRIQSTYNRYTIGSYNRLQTMVLLYNRCISEKKIRTSFSENQTIVQKCHCSQTIVGADCITIVCGLYVDCMRPASGSNSSSISSRSNSSSNSSSKTTIACRVLRIVGVRPLRLLCRPRRHVCGRRGQPQGAGLVSEARADLVPPQAVVGPTDAEVRPKGVRPTNLRRRP